MRRNSSQAKLSILATRNLPSAGSLPETDQDRHSDLWARVPSLGSYGVQRNPLPRRSQRYDRRWLVDTSLRFPLKVDLVSRSPWCDVVAFGAYCEDWHANVGKGDGLAASPESTLGEIII